MVDERLIEIGQDAAGIIETGRKDARGFFTGGVESCFVYIFACKRAKIMVHDSAQLKLTDIVTLVEEYGGPQRIIAAYFVGGRMLKEHLKRQRELLSLLRYRADKVGMFETQKSTFSFIYRLDGVCEVVDDARVSALPRIPEREKRQAICEINNAFAPENLGALGLDIQYRGGEYLPTRGLDMPLGVLLGRVAQEPRHFFLNVAVLAEGHRQGLLELPQDLWQLANQYELGRFRFRPLVPREFEQQQMLFEQYMHKRA